MSTKTTIIKFQSELKDNEPEFFEAKVTVDYEIDKNYRADSDGNRGIEKLFINDIQIHSCIDSQATVVELPLKDRMVNDIWDNVWENFQG